MEKEDLVMRAASDLVGRVGNEIEYLVLPRYMDAGDGNQIQTNIYSTLSEVEYTEVIISGLGMLLGQVAALIFIKEPFFDQEAVYSKINKTIRKYGEAYHKDFLQNKETQYEQNASKGS